MKSAKTYILGLSIIVMMAAAAPLVSAEAVYARWDMISVNFGPPVSLSPGGSATAIASDGSTIAITGSGTFVSPAHGGSSSAVKGGGTWKVVSGSGTTGGTFELTELVRWEQSNPRPSFLIDNVGTIKEAFGGLAVPRVAYSDGSTRILTISCNAAPLDPFAVFEEMIASKGVIQYWNPSIFQTLQPVSHRQPWWRRRPLKRYFWCLHGAGAMSMRRSTC